MEMLHEAAPFLLGMIVPPIIMLVIRAHWSGTLKFTAAFLPAFVLGSCTSLLSGELASGFPDALIAIIIDTSLVYTGSQLAYCLLWKPVLEERLRRNIIARMERTS